MASVRPKNNSRALQGEWGRGDSAVSLTHALRQELPTQQSCLLYVAEVGQFLYVFLHA